MIFIAKSTAEDNMPADRCPTCHRTYPKNRSLNQNAYMFGVVYKHISDHLGYSVDEVHDLMKHKFLGRMILLGNENFLIPISTTDLDTKSMEEYLKNIREWASSSLNCYIPLPNEINIF